MLKSLHDPPIQVVLWNGDRISTSDRSSVPSIVFPDRASLYRLLCNPDFQFGELYTSGRIRIEGDLIQFLESVYRAQALGGVLDERATGWFNRVPLNTLPRARENIEHHYDIGNDFYRLWLDEAMVYTCAYFLRPDVSLEAAQAAKMEHVCRKLRLQPGQTVAEAGCGWGALALYMARHHGVKVKAFNISRQQLQFARDRAKAEGLDNMVEFIEDDYRNISGRFDAFVSVGMLEHVGPRHYGQFGRVISRCLTASGRGLIHSIGRHRPIRLDAWTARRIFPGGYTPSLKEMADIFEPNSFAILDVENLRLHYAATLRHWLNRFEHHRGRVLEMFDERFVRMWRLYLSGSLAAFATGWMQLFQVTFNRCTDNDIPWTRKHLYRDAD